MIWWSFKWTAKFGTKEMAIRLVVVLLTAEGVLSSMVNKKKMQDDEYKLPTSLRSLMYTYARAVAVPMSMILVGWL